MADALLTSLPTFGSDGTMFGNLTSSQGEQPSENTLTSTDTGNAYGFDNSSFLSGVQNLFGGGVVTGAGSSGTPYTGSNLGPLQPATSGTTTGATATTNPASGAATSGSGSSTSTLSSMLPRLGVIILGFIFVAAGLYMFKGPSVIQSVVSKTPIP